MKNAVLLALSLLTYLLPGSAQNEDERKKIMEIQAKMRAGGQVTAEDRAFLQGFNQRAREEFPKTHPLRASTGMIPLTDLGKATYQGEQGGLYPGGENAPPKAHLESGIAMAKTVKPLDDKGQPAKDGKIGMVSIGMSNTTMESQALLKLLPSASGVNPNFVFVDCAQNAQTAMTTRNAGSNYWTVAMQRLTEAGLTPEQVQVAWILEANAVPLGDFHGEANNLKEDLAGTLHSLHTHLPNVKIAYLSSRIYAGLAVTPLNPEPYAYEGGFAVKWLIADQINGKPELNNNPAKGPVVSPWIAWGPYLWADGTKGRKTDDLVYGPADFGKDGTHPSPVAREKVARMLLGFLQTDPTAKPWFLAK